MTEATASTSMDSGKKGKPAWKDDPEQYRMSIGDHLEELRWRIILALIGFVVVLAVCLFYGTHVQSAFCAPLTQALEGQDLNPQLYYRQIGEPFMVYLQISMITAGAFAAPWILYQLWMFVAAGLYPNERKAVTRYLPFSITLLVTGMLFVYLWVLPFTINFFVRFASGVPRTTSAIQVDQRPANPVIIPDLAGDPMNPLERELWFNTHEGRIKIFINGQIRSLPFGPESLLAPQITLQEYINLVILMLISFGLAFQLPLVVMAIIRVGIMDAETLRRSRRIVYFALVVIAACITPGDVVTATLALTVPLVGLYELGIFMGARGKARAQATEDADNASS